MTLLSEQVKRDALVRLQRGESTRAVAAALRISQSAVEQLRKQVGKHLRQQRGRHPRALEEHQKRQALAILTSGQQGSAKKTAQQFRSKIEKFVSDVTMWRALWEVVLAAQVQGKKPFLRKKHVMARLWFARTYENSTVADWKRVIISDETKIMRFNSGGRSWC